jgi:hypothetical protein
MPRKKNGNGAKASAFKGATHAVFVLDRTGSMGSIAKQAVDGFNEWLTSLEGYERVTVDAYQFDAHGQEPTVQTMFTGEKPETAPRLFNAQYGAADVVEGKLAYVPRGGTPLFDAVGQVLTNTPVPGEADRLLVAVLTDGYENSSREWTQEAVKKIVADREATGRVTITFMIGGMDTTAARAYAGTTMGTSAPANTTGFTPDAVGSQSMLRGNSGSTSSYMAAGASSSASFSELPIEQVLVQRGIATDEKTAARLLAAGRVRWEAPDGSGSIGAKGQSINPGARFIVAKDTVKS